MDNFEFPDVLRRALGKYKIFIRVTGEWVAIVDEVGGVIESSISSKKLCVDTSIE